jgi:hypothetical protein
LDETSSVNRNDLESKFNVDLLLGSSNPPDESPSTSQAASKFLQTDFSNTNPFVNRYKPPFLSQAPAFPPPPLPSLSPAVLTPPINPPPPLPPTTSSSIQSVVSSISSQIVVVQTDPSKNIVKFKIENETLFEQLLLQLGTTNNDRARLASALFLANNDVNLAKGILNQLK